MQYIDFEKNMYTQFYGLAPTEVYGQSNMTNYFYKRYLYNKIYSGYDIKLISNWALNVFRFCLFRFGSIAIFKYNGGWTFGSWAPSEYDNQMNPIKVYCHTLLDKYHSSKQVYTVGKDCIIVKCFDDYLGWDDLVCETSELMANCNKTTNIALMNANVNLYATVKDDKQKAEIESAYQEATEGKPLVFIDKENKNEMVTDNNDNLLNPWTNHDTIGAMDRILVARRTILNNFLTEIGIKNANTQKKERLISDEVNQNNEETSANINICYNNIKEAFDKFNEISGLSEKLSIDLHYDYNSDGDNMMSVSEVIEDE
mgnify:FL=1